MTGLECGLHLVGRRFSMAEQIDHRTVFTKIASRLGMLDRVGRRRLGEHSRVWIGAFDLRRGKIRTFSAGLWSARCLEIILAKQRSGITKDIPHEPGGVQR